MTTARRFAALTAIIVLHLLFWTGIASAQEDSTVQWRVSLRELEQRLTALPSVNATTVQNWRDALDLRTSLAAFAASSRNADSGA